MSEGWLVDHGSTKMKLNMDSLDSPSFLQRGNETEMKPQGVSEKRTKTGKRVKLTIKAKCITVVMKSSTLKIHPLMRHTPGDVT